LQRNPTFLAPVEVVGFRPNVERPNLTYEIVFEESLKMAGTFKFELVSPERVLLSVDAEQVELPGGDGDFTVMPGHAPVISTLRPGTIHARTKDAKKGIFVKSGFVEVGPDKVVVLADQAFMTDEVDVRQIEAELKATELALAAANDDEARRHLGIAIEQMRAIVSARQRG
jgi:F-type H+-transporting ATPase subunit epsilon